MRHRCCRSFLSSTPISDSSSSYNAQNNQHRLVWSQRSNRRAFSLRLLWCVLAPTPVTCSGSPSATGPCSCRHRCRRRRDALHEPARPPQSQVPDIGNCASRWTRQAHLVRAQGYQAHPGMARPLSRRCTKHCRERKQLGALLSIVRTLYIPLNLSDLPKATICSKNARRTGTLHARCHQLNTLYALPKPVCADPARPPFIDVSQAR